MNRQELIDYLRANQIWAKRTMGQNFLVDEQALLQIVAAADIQPTDTIVEIGPGLGVLTAELSKRAGKVIAIEKDDKFADVLKTQYLNSNVEIVHQDALNFEPNTYGLIAESYKLVANIPYNITSLIIRKFLEEEDKPEMMILLVQKEVAERIIAEPGDMSLLAVCVQFYAEAKIVAIVPKESFFPVPKVDSAIIKLKVKNQKHKVQSREFFRIVKFGFAAKRKTLENNLSAGMHIKKDDARDIIKKAGFEAKIRAEDLSVEDWIRLFEIIKEGDSGEKRENQNL
jgi:16S rRNA (adenine1518-N6/adenine1519-N6)-dimethyltransferase